MKNSAWSHPVSSVSPTLLPSSRILGRIHFCSFSCHTGTFIKTFKWNTRVRAAQIPGSGSKESFSCPNANLMSISVIWCWGVQCASLPTYKSTLIPRLQDCHLSLSFSQKSCTWKAQTRTSPPSLKSSIGMTETHGQAPPSHGNTSPTGIFFFCRIQHGQKTYGNVWSRKGQ